jgi:hypothetical protein
MHALFLFILVITKIFHIIISVIDFTQCETLQVLSPQRNFPIPPLN